MQWASSITIAWTHCWYGWLWNSSIPFLHDKMASGWVKIMSYLASLSQEEFAMLVSSSLRSWPFFPFLTLSIAALTFPSVLLLIWSLIKAFNGETAIITGWIGDCSVARELTFAEKKKVQAANGRLWIFRIPYPVPGCLQTLYLFRFNIDIPVAAFDDRGLKAAIKHGRSRTRKVCLVLMLIKICGDKTFRNRDPSWVFFLLGDTWPAFSRVSLSLTPWGRLGENPGSKVAVIPVPKAMYLLITLPHLTLLKSMKWITKSELLIMTTNFKDQLSSFYLL